MVRWRPIHYSELDSKQKENYNFLKLSAVLADYGFVTTRLTADWKGADFIAHHIDGETFLKVQLKGRLYFGKKYLCKGINIAFFSQEHNHWYFYPHDELLEEVLPVIGETESWKKAGEFHYPKLSKEMLERLEPYKIKIVSGLALPEDPPV